MTVWVLHCWALDLPWGEMVSKHTTLEDAVDQAAAWYEAACATLSQRDVYSIAELRYDEPHS